MQRLSPLATLLTFAIALSNPISAQATSPTETFDLTGGSCQCQEKQAQSADTGSCPKRYFETPSGCVKFPKVKRQRLPEYPPELLDKPKPGCVGLRIVIEPDGTVGQIAVIQATDPLFKASAVEAVRAWKFKPATLNGSAVAVSTCVDVHYVPPTRW